MIARMRPDLVALVVASVAATIAFSACGDTSGPTTPTARGPVTARELYPLAEGYAWSYEVDTGDEDMHLTISRVLAVTGGVAEVSNGVDDLPLRYELRPRGIFSVNTDTWLIRDPIRVGAEWPSARGATARITNVDRRVVTPAGTFRHCVLVVESGGEFPRRIETTYCPNVGPAEVDVRAVMTLGRARAHALLRGYTVEPSD